MKIFIYLLTLILLTQLTGCIVFNTVSYEVTVNEDGTGTALVFIEDLKTDATNQESLNQDVKSVLDYGLKSQDFIKDREGEGKKVTNRNLVVEKGKLNAIVRYDFDDVSKVEGMQFDDPYYYLTVSHEDSIVSTNGQITKTKEYKRIIWDKSMTSLKFKMYSDDTNKEGLQSLASYYLKEN
jgi:hypothetical protein